MVNDMNTSSLKTRIKKLEIANGSKLPVYKSTIYRFGEEVPPVKYEPNLFIKDFTGSLISNQWYE